MILTTELLNAHLDRPVKLVNALGELNGTLAAFGSDHLSMEGITQYFERSEWAVFTAPLPVALPTVPGSVICWTNGAYLPQIAQLDAGHMDLGWFTGADDNNRWYTADQLAAYIEGAPFTRLRREAEVADEVLADLAAILSAPFSGWTIQASAQIDALAAKWATK